MNNNEFRKFAEHKRFELKQRGQCGSSSNLYIDAEKRIAVIGIQTVGETQEYDNDTIYVVREKDNKTTVETVLNYFLSKGRMRPTGISKDGKKFFYNMKNDQGILSRLEKQI